MRNGSLFARLPPQILESQQHGQGAFQLAVQVHLVTGQPRQLVGIEGLGESLRPYEGAVFQFLASLNIPGPQVSLDEPAKTVRIRPERCLALVEIPRIARQHILPPFAGIGQKCRDRMLVGLRLPASRMATAFAVMLSSSFRSRDSSAVSSGVARIASTTHSICLPLSGAAAADCVSLQKCVNLSEDGSRLACYDGLMRAATADPNEPSKNFWSGPVGQKNPLSKHDALDRATATVKEEIIARCRKKMEQFGSAMVKACVDEDLDAYRGWHAIPMSTGRSSLAARGR